MNHIELFAGCGGLSLGLEKAGFKLSLANELSPMAAETFTFNFLNEDLADLADRNLESKNAIWLNSNHRKNDLKSRLRENPFTYPSMGVGENGIDIKSPSALKGKLIVGSIVELNKLLAENTELVQQLRNGFGEGGLDLVSGGPPCQSFSMAGLRQKDCEKNTLPWEFANFVSYTQPKIAVLENVTGILRAFKDEEGNKFHAWFEIAKVFASKGYIPLCLHVNARLAGIAQNRPRFIMIAIREDYYRTIAPSFKPNSAEKILFSPSEMFFSQVKKNIDKVKFGSLPYFDATKPTEVELFKKSFLSHLVDEKEVTVLEAIDDLKIHNPSKPSTFINNLNDKFKNVLSRPFNSKSLANNEPRNNGDLVKRRFRIYQILQQIDDKSISKAVFMILKGLESKLNDQAWQRIKGFSFLQVSDENDALAKFDTKEEFVRFLMEHPTKKQTQKALIANSPAPAALSIPDDACHYDEHELRVLTVREMARIQSFPDNFVFRSKVTTGGKMRKFEVPQYTQVGNAVPPLLGLALGNSIKILLKYK